MQPAEYGLVLVFLTLGLVLGWWGNKTYASHSDVKAGRQRLRSYRKARGRNSVITALLALAIGVVVFDLLRPHP
jgi:hypothetical protein